MTAQIALDVEIDLTIQQDGIVPRFLAWLQENESWDEVSEYPTTGRITRLGLYHPVHTDTYEAQGLWTVGIPKVPFRPELKDAILYVHIYPNVPMQVFAEKFPEFLKAIGVEKFEIRIPRYLECVKRAVEFLERGTND